eukprot:7841173-Pyramimonas_sp.AAC.1
MTESGSSSASRRTTLSSGRRRPPATPRVASRLSARARRARRVDLAASDWSTRAVAPAEAWRTPAGPAEGPGSRPGLGCRAAGGVPDSGSGPPGSARACRSLKMGASAAGGSAKSDSGWRCATWRSSACARWRAGGRLRRTLLAITITITITISISITITITITSDTAAGARAPPRLLRNCFSGGQHGIASNEHLPTIGVLGSLSLTRTWGRG